MELMIRQTRISNRWTQENVAERIGVTKATIQMLETAQRKPSYEVLVLLEDLFGKTHRELFSPASDAATNLTPE